MVTRFVTEEKVLDKIDEVKKKLGIEVSNYSSAMEAICNFALEELELRKKYEENLECMFNLLMEYRSDLVYSNGLVLKEFLQTYKTITS